MYTDFPEEYRHRIETGIIADDAETYGPYLNQQITERLKADPRDDVTSPTFFKRAIIQIDRLRMMKGGVRYAFKLLVILQTDMLFTRLYARPYYVRDQALFYLSNNLQKRILDILTVELYYKQDPDSLSQLTSWASRQYQACRSERCRIWCGHVCIHDGILRVLDSLQRYAHTAIRVNVLRAVGRKFPKEITDLVLHFTLCAENIPDDPRVVIGTGDRKKPWRIAAGYACKESYIAKYGLTVWEDSSGIWDDIDWKDMLSFCRD